MNARQKRLFEESLRKNPNLKMPTEAQPSSELTDEDMALLKQGVGDKTGRPQNSPTAASGEASEEAPTDVQTGSVMTYFEEKGFGFLRPDGGGKDIFFHISRLHQGDATALVPGAKVAYDLGMDRNGKIAASSVRLLEAEEKPQA
ncbi:MAG TPA: cold shock domain-containing protein [Bryobacteraceae bacterium]|jgi:CspA family cold shock protein|nr:cold shock domain-containing protein [Bryobacteraceae bacterium]